MEKIMVLLTVCISAVLCQHSIPFASTNNTIELSVANSSSISTSNVIIAVSAAPEWLNIVNRKLNIQNLNAKEMQAVRFAFSVDKSAPVNKPENVTFTITNSSGEKWTKTLSLQVSPPEKFELFQNYPNPFNPSTTISYLLPATSTVSIKIFDMLGREVTVLLNNEAQEPGYHQLTWNASNNASGVYVYQIYAKGSDNKKDVARKKMLLVK